MRVVAVLYHYNDDVPSLFIGHVFRFGPAVHLRHVGRIFTPGFSDPASPRRWWWWALQGGALISIRSMRLGPGGVTSWAVRAALGTVRTEPPATAPSAESWSLECSISGIESRAKQLLCTIRYRTLDIKQMNQTKKGVRDYIVMPDELIYNSVNSIL